MPNLQDYKLQFADVIDGTLTAIPRGIFAVAAVLQGSRGGADIPAGDKDAIKSKVSSYYSAMRKKFDDESITPPWEGKSLKEAKPWNVFHEGDKWNVYKVDADGNQTGDALGSHDNEADARAQVRALYADENSKSSKAIDLTSYIQEVTEAFNEQYGGMGGMMVNSECYCIWRVYDDHLVVCEMMHDDYYSVDYTLVDGKFIFAAKTEWIEGDLQFVPETITGGEMKRRGAKTAQPVDALKAGRIMAGRNMDRLKRIMAEVQALMDDAAMNDRADDTDNTDNAPAEKRAAAPRESKTQAGPTHTSPTDTALRQSLEIEIETLKLLEV